MSNIEKVKAEIERLKAENRNIRCQHNENYCIGYDDAFSDLLSVIDSLPEEKPSEELEEAAEDFVWEVMENDENGISDLCRKLRPSSKISDFYDALAEFFKAGAKWQKSQMLKDAVEGEVIYDLGGFFRIKSEAIDGAKYKVGSWVKLIIVKED